MNWKKAIVLLLSLALTASSFVGCSTPHKQTQKTNVAMGRYVEQAVKMPEAVTKGKEYAYILIKNPKGLPEIYTSPAKSNNGEYVIQYTLSSDNTWKRTVPKWLNIKHTEVTGITYAPDGTKYAILLINQKHQKQLVKIIKSQDNEKSTEIQLNQYKSAVSYNDAPFTIDVLKDNTILLGCTNAFSAYKDGSKIYSFKTSGLNYAISGNQMLSMNQKQDGVVKVDLTTGKTVSKLPSGSSTNSMFTADKAGNWYQLSDLGIARMAKNGGTWEVMVDANLTSISMPSLNRDAIITGDKDDFYVLFETGNGLRSIYHYTYDKDIPTIPDKTLSIVSLKENDTIRQAITGFQNEHQDVKVEYKVLMDGDDSTTASDHIKTINTELLAGKGADLLVLDGLPVESYIEKGVLSDISNIMNPLLKKKELLGNIMNNYKRKGGKIYYAPLRIGIAYCFGNKEAVEATKSLDALAKYAQKSKTPLLGTNNISYTYLTELLFRYYSDSFLSDQGFDRNGLIDFLKNLKIISDQTCTDLKGTDDWLSTQDSRQITNVMADSYYSGYSLLGMADLTSMLDTFSPITAVDKKDGSYACLNGQYHGFGYMGINNASTQKKLAAEFITTLFGDKIQKTELGDGFPVNAKALETYQLASDDYCISFDDFEAKQPSVDKMKTILAMCKSCTTPVSDNQVLLDMLKKEITPYLSGSADLNSTADKIIAETKTYLSE